MATTELKINGLDQLRADLKRLPADLQREAAVIVQAQAEQMAVEVQGAFPQGTTGNLRSQVRVVVASDVCPRFCWVSWIGIPAAMVWLAWECRNQCVLADLNRSAAAGSPRSCIASAQFPKKALTWS